jgi:hypothetical protein
VVAPSQPFPLTGDGIAGGAALLPEAEVYVASNPAPFTDPSEENTTYSWPVSDVTVTGDGLVPVTDSKSGAVDDVPPYTLTKS